jgi:hypothetical protein
MRKSSIGFFATLALIVNRPAMAGYFTGTLHQVWAGDANVRNLGWVAPAGNLTAPACGSANYLWLDLNDPLGKIHFSTALAALAAGKTVTIYGDGAGSCNGSYERVRAVIVNQ